MNSDNATVIAVAIGSAIVSFLFASMRERQRHDQAENKKLADAVLVQNEKHNALDKRVAVLEAKDK